MRETERKKCIKGLNFVERLQDQVIKDDHKFQYFYTAGLQGEGILIPGILACMKTEDGSRMHVRIWSDLFTEDRGQSHDPKV